MKSLQNDQFSIKGSFIIRTYKAGTKELLRESPVIHNTVVSSSGYGRNLIMRRIAGDTTYGIEIDSAAIGTGTTAPTDNDTGLQTSVLSGIVVADTDVVNNVAVMSFFMTDTELANGTYTEFGVFIDGRLFARSLITPNHTKSANEDTSVDYTFTLT